MISSALGLSSRLSNLDDDVKIRLFSDRNKLNLFLDVTYSLRFLFLVNIPLVKIKLYEKEIN